MLALALLGLPIAAAAQPTVRIPRVAEPPRIEHYLDGRSRQAEARVTGFVQREPGDGAPSSQTTEAYLSYDDRHLYIVFVCRDTDPDQIRARLTRREAFFGDDAVGVVLDTFHDRRRAYLFIVNPLGIQLDGVTTEGQDDDYSFDTLWYSQGRLTADGYVVWLAIPFKSLRFPDAAVQTWGVALARIIPRTNETVFWPYLTRRVAGFLQQLATLEGLQGISPGRNVQLIPYGTFAGARFLDSAQPAFVTDEDARGGFDAKVVLRDSFSLDVAVNPDFSQVESDEPQVTINQRFEVFFPEKRPFFLENAGHFETPTDLFFSRRIADPQVGVRLTGKAGRWAIGGLAIDDRGPGRLVAREHPAHGSRTGILALRAQRELGQQSTVGLLVTSRDFGAESNRVLSVDTRLTLHPNWIFRGQAIASATTTLDGTGRAGPAYFAELRRSGRNLFYSGRYMDRSPGFRSQLGFIPRVDIRQVEQSASYRWRPAGPRLVSYGPGGFALANWDREGRLQDWLARGSFQVELAGQTHVGFNRREAFERFQEIGFRRQDTDVWLSSDRLKWMQVSAVLAWGTSINFFPAGGLAPCLADARFARFSVLVRPTTRFQFDQTYLYSHLQVRPESAAPGTAGGTDIFNNHLLRSRVSYQFTRALSMRVIVDYNGVLPNPALIDLERAKGMTGDLLFTWLVHPGTALYVGYTERLQNLSLDDRAPDGLRRIGGPTTSVGRQLFVKASYLVRF